MIYQDAQLARQLKPHLERVMVLDGTPASARLLSEMLRDLGAGQVSVQPNNTHAITAMKSFAPQLVFTELAGHSLDGLEFTRVLRRSDLSCRTAPVILTSTEATSAALLASRNAGVHEFLRKPYTIRDVMRRLDAALLRQRIWIEAVSYIGPDRRRFNTGDYAGPPKRLNDEPAASDAERLTQALKILRAVIPAIDSDPVQSLRAMRAQADELARASLGLNDPRLTVAVTSLQRCLGAAAATGRLWRPDVEASARALWAFLPEDSANPVLKVG